ncbi:Rho GTPase activation protein [Phycomyces nitens]|nr:Rho GTPase activation protein [Phycomyces nitens]
MTEVAATTDIARRHSFRGWLRKNVLPAPSRKSQTSFKKSTNQRPGTIHTVFGVPLSESLCYARSTVGYVDEDMIKHRRAGAIPIIIAKCGAFLKQNALHEQGIFRLSGSMKRINELQQTFDNPATAYGLHFNWDSYTIHDAASVMRRFLNKLPEPVIPLDYYQDFRDVMSDKFYHTTEDRVTAFQQLILTIPPAHQHLLLYLLDMLNMFACNSAENLMDASNLAAVFCPGILNHPDHVSAVHYKISQRVIEFLIEFQALFTMQLLIQKPKQLQSDTLDIPTQVNTQGSIGSPKDLSPRSMIDTDEPLPVKQRILPQPLNMTGLVYNPTRSAEPSLHNPNDLHISKDEEDWVDSGTDVKTPASFMKSPKKKEIQQSIPEEASDDDIPTPKAAIPNPFNTLPEPKLQEEPKSQDIVTSISEAIQPLKKRTIEQFNHLKDTAKPYFVQPTDKHLVYSGTCEDTQHLSEQTTLDPPAKDMVDLQGDDLITSSVSIPRHIDQDSDDALSLFDDISIAEDRATEEAMMKDESIMSEWKDLLTRAWRADISMPKVFPFYSLGNPHAVDGSNKLNNLSGDENKEFECSDDAFDTASLCSVSSVTSRFDEESNPSEDEDFDKDCLPELSMDEMESYWEKFQQIEKDTELAKVLQKEQDEEANRVRLQNNPFITSATSPTFKEKEEWKLHKYAK